MPTSYRRNGDSSDRSSAGDERSPSSDNDEEFDDEWTLETSPKKGDPASISEASEDAQGTYRSRDGKDSGRSVVNRDDGDDRPEPQADTISGSESSESSGEAGEIDNSDGEDENEDLGEGTSKEDRTDASDSRDMRGGSEGDGPREAPLASKTKRRKRADMSPGRA